VRAIRPLLLAALATPPTPSAAADWLLCPPQSPAPTVDVAAPAPGVTRAAADAAEHRGQTTILTGDAGVRRGSRTLGAERIRLNRTNSTVEAEGSLFLRQQGLTVTGERGRADLDSGAFRVDATNYRLRPRHVQGRATRIERNPRGISELADATYSTCPREAEAWSLDADSVTLNPNTRQGTARDAVLWFQDVPLFYTPWFRFPLGDDRMSGLLVPRFGSSSSTGYTLGVPYYWNIAPNLDATLEPRYLGRRGPQLRWEVRWLNEWGSWRVNNAYLPDDNVFGADRTLTRVEHQGRFGPWRTEIEAATASDQRYFEDLGTSLALASQTHLRRRADARWSGAPGQLRARVETYQTLDPTLTTDDRPYERVPQLTFASQQRLGPLTFDFDSELVQFERADSDTGTRLHLRPALSSALEAPGWFLEPRLAWDYTAYNLDRVTSTGPSQPQRSLPVLSIDSGLVFERFGAAYRQTLEPRAFYVYVPEASQDQLPVFDTGEYSFSFSQLFRERRFTGPDRRGDANRLTLALTTRLLDRAQGRELLRASLGSITHFAPRTVQLPGRADERFEHADLAGELAVQPSAAWRGTLDLRYDRRRDRIREGAVNLRFDNGENRLFNAGYRYGRDLQAGRDRKKAIDAAFAWPLSNHWLAVGGTRYSLVADANTEPRNVETFLGAEYDNCCWKVRAVARRYVSGDEQANSISVELVLKGLGGLGDDTGDLLERAILGYSR
jgi:LPS-assembly protein